MNRSRLRRLLPIFVVVVGTAATSTAGSAGAADASAWVSDAHSAMRLVAGSARKAPGEPLRAGVEVKLAPGWKTYWRYPGDAGIAPRFDFTRSSNVKAVTVQWPAPRRFTDAGGATIGYTDGVIWPITIEPTVAGEPVRLRLKLDYAICDNLCVPVDGAVELTLDGAASSYDPVLAEAERRVPRKAALGEGSPAIRAVRRDAGGPRPRVTVDVAAPADQPVDLFVEGPTPDWALPLPDPAPAPPGLRRFSFEIDGLPPGARIEGAPLRFTLVAPGHATEVTTRLD